MLTYVVDTTVVIRRNVLTPGECDRLIDTNRDHTREIVPEHGGGLVQAHGIDEPEHLCGLQPRLYALFRQINRELDWRIPMDIARFGCSGYHVGGSMGAHVDDEERDPPPWDLPHRGISFSIQLSDPRDYKGGQLRILDTVRGWYTPASQRGDLIAFGSSTEHEVTEVTAGERWALLGWAYTNHDKRAIR